MKNPWKIHEKNHGFFNPQAMYHLGVDTTRALSLVVSDGGEMAERPWYSDGNRDRDPVPRQRRDRKGGGRRRKVGGAKNLARKIDDLYDIYGLW